ncbi:MAG TPA: RHS repeat-associated core domain-containing protein [Pyrinomonadaceae bacterium]|nr:RHS repeat-associated core domain-containing protein [Pyrinomonadaceae bacterium]
MDGAGNVVARHDYLPFGEELWAGVGMRTPAQQFGAMDQSRMRYAMTEKDDTTGLDHTWWRKYENAAGRWTTPDPISGDISDPQSLNSYTYTINDPINLVDPTGLLPCVGAQCGWGDVSFGFWGGAFDLNDRPRAGRRILVEGEFRDLWAQARLWAHHGDGIYHNFLISIFASWDPWSGYSSGTSTANGDTTASTDPCSDSNSAEIEKALNQIAGIIGGKLDSNWNIQTPIRLTAEKAVRRLESAGFMHFHSYNPDHPGANLQGQISGRWYHVTVSPVSFS